MMDSYDGFPRLTAYRGTTVLMFMARFGTRPKEAGASLQEIFREVAPDQYSAGAAIATSPVIQDHWRVEDVLNRMDDKWCWCPFDVNDPLQAQVALRATASRARPGASA